MKIKMIGVQVDLLFKFAWLTKAKSLGVRIKMRKATTG